MKSTITDKLSLKHYVLQKYALWLYSTKILYINFYQKWLYSTKVLYINFYQKSLITSTYQHKKGQLKRSKKRIFKEFNLFKAHNRDGLSNNLALILKKKIKVDMNFLKLMNINAKRRPKLNFKQYLKTYLSG